MTRRPQPPRPAPAIVRPSTVIHADGTTAQERVVSAIRAGTHPASAAVGAGMGEADYRQIMTTGGRVMAEYIAGADWHKDFTPAHQEAAAFFNEVTVAAKAGESIRRTKLEQLARGELSTTRTVTKRDVSGTVIEESVTIETELPDAASLRWLLERESPEIYAARSEIGLVVADVSDSKQVGASLLRVLDGMRSTPTPGEKPAAPVTPSTRPPGRRTRRHGAS